jgi:6-phosphogluconate dehydrogenase (decarboxylating)
MKLGMTGLGRMGADIPARAIHPEAGVDVLVEQWCPDFPDPGARRIK